ncbi:Bifunctional polymyxin resistance protein ArnA [subsurface metagenome]
MICLVTGGAGFIGSHLTEELLKQGNEVFVVDNFSTGSFKNICHLKESKNLHLIITNITDKPTLELLVAQCDVIYHLAAAVGVKRIIQEPVETIETNILGSHTILSLAAKYNKKILISSTSEVYGKGNKMPFKEDNDCVLGPTIKNRWSYACSKAMDEFLALAYYKEKGLPIIIARLFNIIGPRQTGTYGMVVPTFIEQALKGFPITVFGDGKQTRSFTYINDAVQVMIKLMLHPKSIGDIFNIGNDFEISIIELALKIKKKTRSQSKIVYIPYDKAYEEGFEDMLHRVPDISKIKTLIDYKFITDLDTALELIIKYFIDLGGVTNE